MSNLPTAQHESDEVESENRWVVPSWGVSVVFHALLVIAMGLFFRFAPQGAAAEDARGVGIVLAKQGADGQTEFFDEGDDGGGGQAETVTGPSAQANAGAKSFTETKLTDVTGALPKTGGAIGVSGAETGGLDPNAGSLTKGPRKGAGVGGGGSAQIFGVKGYGTHFVYVFDRSLSMQGAPLAAAKAELLTSVASLQDTHEFQIIFYNNSPSLFNAAGAGRRSWASDQNKELARRYVSGITASGGTNHEDALMAAIGLNPDVIFLLSDAKSNLGEGLNAAQFERVKRRCRASISTVEFGVGPSADDDSFMARLARATGGQYGYVDVTTLGR